MSEVSHHLLLSYLARPEMSCLLDTFWDTVTVTKELPAEPVKIWPPAEKRHVAKSFEMTGKV